MQLTEEVLAEFNAEWSSLPVPPSQKIREVVAELIAAWRENEARKPKPGQCEHGIGEGDWCEPCNAAYKQAREDKDNAD